MSKSRLFLILLLVIFIYPVLAYVGPGAGFAFAGSFLFIFAAFFLAFFNFLTFPIRALIKFIKRYKTLKHARYKRVIIIGFDGMDYKLMNRFMKAGKHFPHFEKLAEQGTFAPLLSTEPPISPVAWSTFATGVNPGKHNIFDFLTTDRKTYMPKISCSEIIPPKRFWHIGKWTVPLSRPKIELKRKSQSFWKIVGDRGIFASVLRVPYTFPPEKFYGTMLSGLGTPDLRGSQGSFSFYTTDGGGQSDIWEGEFEKLEKVGEHRYTGKIKGPANPFVKGNPPLKIPFYLTLHPENGSAVFEVNKEKVTIEANKISDWVKLEFKAGLVKIAGVTQLALSNTDPVRLYLAPINIDPESPSMAVSHPRIFSVYLAKLLGPFATLGMVEDTTAVNEKVLSESLFVDQVYNAQREREQVFFDSLKKLKKGLVVQVFEATDRIQHMFWRYMKDSGSPAPQPSKDEQVRQAIYHSYRAMDDFLGRLFTFLKDDDCLMIVSDHGFNAFNRGFHLNSWLHKEGYLVLKEDKSESDKWYADVDWSKSKAYGQGLNGMFLNMKGREKYGIVNSGKEAEALKEEIKRKLLKLKDPKTAQPVAKGVWKREEIYKGPYVQNAPDVVVGYNIGIRVSWESSVNYVGNEIFGDNTRMWSGDHAFTRDQVPGIFFCNKRVDAEQPSLMDISPTVLSVLGIKPPTFIDGKNLGIH